MPAKLPVKHTFSMWAGVREAYATAWRYRRQFVRIVWLWLIVYAAATMISTWMCQDTCPDGEWWSAVFPATLGEWVYYIAIASIAVAWHRLILLREQVSGAAYFRFDKTTTLYAIWVFLLVLIVMVWLLPLFYVGHLYEEQLSNVPTASMSESTDAVDNQFSSVQWAISMSIYGALLLLLSPILPLLCWIPTRLSLLLPAIAIETDSISVAGEWRRTRGLFWRLFSGLLLCGLPALISAGAFGLLLSLGLGHAMLSDKLIETAVLATMMPLFLLSEVIGIGYLSIVYRELTRTDPPYSPGDIAMPSHDS